MKCSKCGYEGLAGLPYCGMCGTRLGLVCAACGFVNPVEYRFCGMCGGALTEDAAREVFLAPPVAVQEAVTAPLPTPPTAPPLVSGERRVATILVADVRGSTDLLEKLGTETWVEMMNQVLQLMEAEVYHFGGEVDQFRGDGLLAFFGASAVHEDDPERAVLAGLWMQKTVSDYARDLHARVGIELRIRVGVNTGEVILTSVGEQHSEETAMGEAIAVAARMEAAAEPGTVLASDNTYRLVAERFEWEALGEIMIKGVSQPIAVYRPLAPRIEAGWTPGLHPYGFSIPLIGRQREFQALQHCVEDLYDGRGGIALVSGDKGMGKTFLVGRVQHYLERQGMLLAEARSRDVALAAAQSAGQSTLPPTLTWLRGRCRSYDRSWPYSMWLDMVQDWLNIRYEEPKAEIGARLRQQSAALWGDACVEYYPVLSNFLSLPLEPEFADPVRHMDAEAAQQQFFAVMYAWVEALTRRGPLVLSFSDVQWADDSSVALLSHCLPLCDTEALLWLVVYRPDRLSPAWSFQHFVETEYPHRMAQVALPPFSTAQSAELVGSLVGSETLPEEIVELVVHKAEGNPYYIKELLSALVAQGILTQAPETGVWQVARKVTSLDLPDSLQNLLLARIDRLSLDERHVLQAAAVIGTVFWGDVLCALLEDTSQLRAHLTALQRNQLIHERRRVPGIGMEYAFSSSLIRDVAYESLLRPQRAAYHLRVAEYFEAQLAGEPGGHAQRYGMVAYHYRQAERLEKALDYTLKAAEQAYQFYANVEAKGHYTSALEILAVLAGQAKDTEAQYALRRQRFLALNARRETYYLLGEMDAGREDARAMLELAHALEHDPQLMVDALLEQPGVGSVQGRDELAEGVHLAQEALGLAQQLGDQHREMRALLALTNLYNLHNNPAWQDTGHQALELARQLNDPQAEVEILLRMGWAYGVDNFDRSMEYFDAALRRAQGNNDKAAEIQLLSAMRTPLERTGDYYRMLVEYEQKRLVLSREVGNRYAEGSALVFCGQIQGLWLGDYQAGLSQEREAARIWENTIGVLYPLLRMVQILAALGRYDEAKETLKQARPAGEQDVREMGRAGLALVSAILYNTIGDRRHFERALEVVAGVHQMVAHNLVSRQYQMAALCEEADAHLGLLMLSQDAGEREWHRRAALDASGAALDIYRQFGFVQIVECHSEEILFRHSQALAAHERRAEARDFLQQAYSEMMRKHALIPKHSRFSRTYLENIALHRAIRAAYEGALLEGEG